MDDHEQAAGEAEGKEADEKAAKDEKASKAKAKVDPQQRTQAHDGNVNNAHAAAKKATCPKRHLQNSEHSKASTACETMVIEQKAEDRSVCTADNQSLHEMTANRRKLTPNAMPKSRKPHVKTTPKFARMTQNAPTTLTKITNHMQQIIVT